MKAGRDLSHLATDPALAATVCPSFWVLTLALADQDAVEAVDLHEIIFACIGTRVSPEVTSKRIDLAQSWAEKPAGRGLADIVRNMKGIDK